METSNLAIDLESITNEAFRVLSNAISKKELHLAQRAEQLYREVHIHLKRGMGLDIRSKGITDKTREFDRYLLQYIVGNKTTKAFKKQLMQKTVQFLRPQPPEDFKDILLISKVIDDFSTNDRYPKIENMVYELASRQSYGLLIEALYHIRKKYKELDRNKYKPTQISLKELNEKDSWFSKDLSKK